MRAGFGAGVATPLVRSAVRALQVRCQSSVASSSTTADVAIIGGGIVGCAAQLELARRGLSSVIVDKLSGPGHGSTSYSSGICRTFYSVLSSVQFSYEGYRVWEDWAEYIGVKDERGMAHLRQCGGLVLQSPSAHEFATVTAQHHETCGIPFERWPLEKLLERFPYFDPSLFGPPRRVDDDDFGEPAGGQLSGALYFPSTGYVSDPQLATLNLNAAAKAEQGGTMARVLPNAEFQRLLYANGRVSGLEATTSDGTVTIHAPVVLNAAGPHSSVVNGRVWGEGRDAPQANDMKISTRPFRVEVAHVHPPDGVQYDAGGMVMMDADVGVYSRPEVGNKITVGSLEPECDSSFEEFPPTPEDCSPSLTSAWTNLVYRLALRVPELPIPSASSTQGIVAMYDVSDDWTPVYDRSSIDGYYLAVGTSGNQFKNAGVIGPLVAELITYVENGGDHDASPLQVPLSKTGLTLDSSKFSRLRSALSTSQSVLA